MTNYNVEKDPKGRFARSTKVVETSALGTVYEALDNTTNQLVCWHKFKVEQDLHTRLEKFIHSVLKVEHPSLLVVYGVWESSQVDNSSQFIDFVTQATSKITLREYLTAMKPLKLDDVLLWSFQIASALNYLHSRDEPIVHGNIRPENIFFSIDMQHVILGDLLSSWFLRQVNGPVAKQTSAASVSAGQFFVVAEDEEGGESWDEKDDIFAFGLCLFEMASCVESKDVDTVGMEMNKMKNVGDKEYHSLKDCETIQLKKLIKSCLGPKEMRPSATEILNDSLFYYQRKGSPSASCSNITTLGMTSESDVTDMSPIARSKLEENVVTPCGGISSLDACRRCVIQRNSPSGIPRHLVVQNQTKEPTRVVGDAQVEVLDSPESNNCVRLSIQIPIEGSFKRIEFNFDPLQDSPESLAEEMVIELNLDALQFDVIKQDIERHLQKILGAFPSSCVLKSSSLHESTLKQEPPTSRIDRECETVAWEEQERTRKIFKDTIVSTASANIEHPFDNVSRQMVSESQTTVASCKDTFDAVSSDIDLQLFWDSIYSGNKQKLGYYLQKNPTLVFLKDENQRTPLHVVAAEGYMELVQMLVSYGAPLDATDRWGLTPILEAVASNHQQIVHFLRNQLKSFGPSKVSNQRIPAFHIIPSYYPLFDSHFHLTAQELVSIMYGQDAVLDTSEESTNSSLHICPPRVVSLSALTESSEQQQQQHSSSNLNKEQVGTNISLEFQKPSKDNIDCTLGTHQAELRRIEEEFKHKREQLHRRFTEAKSEIRGKVKQEPSAGTNSSLVSSL